MGFLSKLKGRHASLRISMYADDAVIFMNPRKEDISCIMEIMTAFGEATGLRINMQKSTVAPIRCADIDLDDVLQVFPGPRVNFPTQYLNTWGFLSRSEGLEWSTSNTLLTELKRRLRDGRAACSMSPVEEN